MAVFGGKGTKAEQAAELVHGVTMQIVIGTCGTSVHEWE